MRIALMVWVTFRRMSSHVFKQGYALATESGKVPLELFFNPAILSDDHLFWSSPIFSYLLTGAGKFARHGRTAQNNLSAETLVFERTTNQVQQSKRSPMHPKVALTAEAISSSACE